MTGYVVDLSWKSGVRAIEKLDRLRSTMAVNVLKDTNISDKHAAYIGSTCSSKSWYGLTKLHGVATHNITEYFIYRVPQLSQGVSMNTGLLYDKTTSLKDTIKGTLS